MKTTLRKRLSRVVLVSLSLLIVLFSPQIWLKIKYSNLIYNQIGSLPAHEFAVVFGAWVKEDYSLSDVTRERVEAGVRLYKSGKVKKLFLSGDNRSNKQAEAMANYAVMNGVNANDIIIDKLGIDTNDTCKHFARIGDKAVLITQSYHLPRTLLMCKTSKIDVIGLAVDKLDILSSRGNSLLQIHATRAWRATRESALTWLFLLGLYDRLSTEAETLEQIK
ncbi:MAG TPA: ElyC/SanA/YdcF family protein [Anaerolineales bacterium]|nr:ElyC/SanA/YdcF family protein [Anaerolineales bacterium]